MSEFHYVRTRGPDGGVDACEGPAIGLDLETVLKDGLPPWKIALEIIAALCEILDIADEDGEIHGDVDPRFVFIDETGAVSLEGFGVKRKPTRLPESTPRDTRADLYGLGYTALRCVTNQPVPVPMPDEPEAHDDLVIDLALGIDLTDLDEAMQGDIQWFVAKLMSFDREDRPSALEAWRTFVAFANDVKGPDMAEWCAQALDGGGTRRQEHARAAEKGGPKEPSEDDEDLGGPKILQGFLTGKAVNFDDGGSSSKGGATAFWTREDMKRALDQHKSEVTEDGPPAGVGGVSATSFWSKQQLEAMKGGSADAPRPKRADGEGERRKSTAAHGTMRRETAAPTAAPPPVQKASVPPPAQKPPAAPPKAPAAPPAAPPPSAPRAAPSAAPPAAKGPPPGRPQTPPPPPPWTGSQTSAPVTAPPPLSTSDLEPEPPQTGTLDLDSSLEGPLAPGPTSGPLPPLKLAPPPPTPERRPEPAPAPERRPEPPPTRPAPPPPSPSRIASEPTVEASFDPALRNVPRSLASPPPRSSAPDAAVQLAGSRSAGSPSPQGTPRAAERRPEPAPPSPPQVQPPAPPPEDEEGGGGLRFVLFGGSIAAIGGVVVVALFAVVLIAVLAVSWSGGRTVVAPPVPLPDPVPVERPLDPAAPSPPALPQPTPVPIPVAAPGPAAPRPSPVTSPRPQPPPRPSPSPSPAPGPRPSPQPTPKPQPTTTPKPPPPSPRPSTPAPTSAGDARVTIRSAGRGTIRSCTDASFVFDMTGSFTVDRYKLPVSCLVEIDGARGVFTVSGTGEIACDKQGTNVVCDRATVP